MKNALPAARLTGAPFFFLCLCLCPCFSQPVIYVTNDVHYFADSLHDDGPLYQQMLDRQDGQNVEMTGPVLSALEYTLARDKPDILLINGDLTYNGERESHQELAARLAEIEKLGVKVFVIPGNHDIYNPYAFSVSGDKVLYARPVDPDGFAHIYRDFGYDEAISRDEETLSYVAEPLPGLRLLMLDSAIYDDNLFIGYAEMAGDIPASTRAWIQIAAEDAQKAGALLVTAMHHNLMDHHAMVTQDFTVDDSEALRELFRGAGIQFVLSGHIHAQDISQRETSRGVIYDIATSALSLYPHQVGVLRWDKSGNQWQYRTKKVDVEGWARESHNTDERLLRFSSYAEEFFQRSSEGMVTRRAERAGVTLTPEELQALSGLMGLLNARYFSGTQYLNAGDLSQNPAFQLLRSGRFDFLASYLYTIMEDPPPANTEVSIP
jgi:3',5'-cyclic AMP phosphodiesterase CpdA